jgi:hypothetical protein
MLHNNAANMIAKIGRYFFIGGNYRIGNLNIKIFM